MSIQNRPKATNLTQILQSNMLLILHQIMFLFHLHHLYLLSMFLLN